jgi:hypothetical protein
MQRRPNDPFDPFTPLVGYSQVQDHHVSDGGGSTGPYRLLVSAATPSPACGAEPNDTITSAVLTGVTDEGSYFCTNAYIGDSQCSSPFNDVDVWAVDVSAVPAELRVDVWGCGSEEVSSNIFAELFGETGEGIVATRPTDIRFGGAIVLTATLGRLGRYYLAIGSYCSGGSLNIQNACANPCGADPGFYDIAIAMVQARAQATAAAHTSARADADQLYATRLDDAAKSIDMLDAESGGVLASLSAPEPRFGGSGGLATNGDNLFFLGAGRFPTLYRMDPTSGEVLGKYFTWFGSGYFSDATMLGGEMYLLDYRQRRIHVMDPFEPRYLRSLALGTMHGITIGGGLAALSGPNRLYVADAFNTRSIYEVYPATGALTATLPPIDNRPTALAGLGSSRLFIGDFRAESIEIVDRTGNAIDRFAVDAPVAALASAAGIGPFADFDVDGDVDLKDLATFQTCFLREGVAATECARGDQDGNDGVDLLDATAIPGASTGP